MKTPAGLRACRSHGLLDWAALLIIIGGACAGGCGCGGAPRASGTSRQPSELGKPRLVDPDTRVSVSSLTLDFGRVRVLDQARRDVRVRNDGAATVSITEIRPSDGLPTEAFSYPAAPLNIGPGREASLLITFHPIQPGDVSGSLVLVVENGDESALTITLRGTGYHGESPELAVAPGQLAFDRAMVGTVAVRHLTLVNTGVDIAGTTEDNLHFGAFASDGTWVEQAPVIVGADAADFAIDWPPAGCRAEGLAQGQSVTLRVRFRPSAERASQATLVINSNDPLRPRVEVALSGIGVPFVPCELVVSPPVLNFGSIEDGQTASHSFSVENPDADPSHFCQVTLTLSPATQSEGAFRLADAPADTMLIGGGDTLEVPVTFAPPREGVFNGEVIVEIAGPTPSEVKVPMGGIGLPPCLVIVPPEFDFGFVHDNCTSRQRFFTMYNRCGPGFPVVVDAIDVRQGPSFELTRRPALPTALVAAPSDFAVTFHPRQLGDHVGAITVSIPGKPPAIVPVTGYSFPGEIRTDVFSISAWPKTDILFVIDDSSTMADKQESLARNLAAFVHYAVHQRDLFHIATTTTDVTAAGAAGRLVPLSGPTPKVIDSSTPNPEQVFSQNVAVGTSGSETESLLYPAFLALSSPLIRTEGFYRDEAKLAIVIVSDAADQDPLSNVPSFYEDFLVALKGKTRRNDLTVSAIIPTAAQAPANCTYDTAAAGLDTRVKELVERTGGLLDDICYPDWSRTIEKLGTRVFGVRTLYFLSSTPDMAITPDPITILINQEPLPQYGPKGSKHWDYNAERNAVEFDPLVVGTFPPEGGKLEVTYHVGCP